LREDLGGTRIEGKDGNEVILQKKEKGGNGKKQRAKKL